jgi:hypothetical protein
VKTSWLADPATKAAVVLTPAASDGDVIWMVFVSAVVLDSWVVAIPPLLVDRLLGGFRVLLDPLMENGTEMPLPSLFPYASNKVNVTVVVLDPLAKIFPEGLALTLLVVELTEPGDTRKLELKQVDVSPELVAWR